ncbi:hypothetical protein EYF80_031678 [Liparis tanakae]|uniref:Uncharacterized protein n=1 Tax=Liparis tanakae TaxID=230148 RepID=A0A4Z2GX97_9TELE|nr:hypothetical protein EYF80_031678 [Liparis tanakae]
MEALEQSEREEGWLILCYVAPPTLRCMLQGRRWSRRVCQGYSGSRCFDSVASCVALPHNETTQ